MKKLLLTYSLFIIACSVFGQPYTITTVAGGGMGNGPATAEALRPYGIATDISGNLYIADPADILIRKVSTNGIITDVAGNCNGGFAGDSGSAIAAELYAPYDVAIDYAGNMYIDDYGNQRIRKVNTAGIITTIVGNGTYGFSGDGGAATAAEVNYPFGITVDGKGNLYIADDDNYRVRMVNTNGVITTVAGNGTRGFSGDSGAATAAEFDSPADVAVDTAGNIYIADEGNNRIRVVSTNGIIATIAGNGTHGFAGDSGAATAAELSYPVRVTVDVYNNIYIADENNNRIRKVSTTGIITTIAGNGIMGYAGDNGPATAAELNTPYGLATDLSGNVYVSDFENHRARKINTNGIITTVAGNGTQNYRNDNGPATAAELWYPNDVSVDVSGDLYIANGDSMRVRMVNTAGIITTVAGNGALGFSGDNGPATAAELFEPTAAVTDDAGNVYIADYGNYRIRVVNTAGIISTFAGTGTGGYSGDGGYAINAKFSFVTGLVFDASGNLYIADNSNACIRKIDTNGIITTIAGTGIPGYAGDNGPATAAQLNYPDKIAVDASDNVYIADQLSNRVRKVSSDGIITTIAGGFVQGFTGDSGMATAAELNWPTGVAVDAYGNVYIGDQENNRIRRINSSGIITTIAGNGTGGFKGDNGWAAAAELHSPCGIVIGDSGSIYFADSYNDRIRKLSGGPDGINEITANNRNVKIYPVPGNGNFTVALKGSGYQLLTVYDETGKQLLSKVLNKKNVNSTIALDMSTYANGIYFAKIIADKGIVNKKIVIQK